MKLIQRRWKLILAAMVPVALGAALLAGYLAGPAAASGIPQTDPLFYSGLLTDKSGTPMSGSQNVGVSLYASASGGKPVCYTTPASTALTSGRFRIAMYDATSLAPCTPQVFQDNPDLWVEVSVNATAMGRTKIGAAPYTAAVNDTLKVNGDATLTVHSNTDTPTSGSKMLVLKTGKTSPKEVFSVDGDGKVGIGITNPTYQFELSRKTGHGVAIKAGATASDHAIVVNNAANSKTFFSVEGDGQVTMPIGNVGIGTATPKKLLDVSGDAQVSGIMDIGQARIGTGAAKTLIFTKPIQQGQNTTKTIMTLEMSSSPGNHGHITVYVGGNPNGVQKDRAASICGFLYDGNGYTYPGTIVSGSNISISFTSNKNVGIDINLTTGTWTGTGLFTGVMTVTAGVQYGTDAYLQ